ncbi:alpha/beta fold hydrolase [Pacificimonas flava]|uniref:Alpha/beta hydrolase n=1 Tax=Pacificimonas flava TaxID=1234595 RepID=M2SFQ0_9SPHN|nr:alpha/beta hydrolase [Pacificimonas flava]EMD84195.1 Alpha/beta hydrolase [Pacificimonas flava]MBB5279927.1 pimeloyl-ACP methyl ester carboxylesterase [Pacificimonas flava]
MQIVGPSSQTVISQRTRLHFADWGNPDAPPLILLHGGRDHCRNWDWTAEALRGDWRVICPDLRGHGDSAWDESGNYTTLSYVYDLAQIVHQLGLSPVTIVAHSLGGNIALRYAGLYPETVRRLVAIEGLGPSPNMIAEREETPLSERWRLWIEEKRGAAGRQPRRYATFEDALSRMQQENTYLSDVQARHLTKHAVIRNEDGTYSWKFDPYVRVWPPVDVPQDDLHGLWSRITCPVRLVYGAESWASNPQEDGRIGNFSNAEVSVYERAGHWVHHDRVDDFLSELRAFL